MAVVLCGIGCDTTNVGRVAPIHEDGSFEYIPIPEKHSDTTETATYGTWDLRWSDGVAADLFSTIRPRPGDGVTITGDDLREWPLHHDPNLDELTYGEHRPGYVDRLTRLEDGDVVGFYAGLRSPNGGRSHRHLIGYFTVASVETIPKSATRAEATAVFERHAENAHAKRARDRVRYYADETVVIVDGREPGGLFERSPLQLSEYTVAPGNEQAQYYLDPSVEEALQITEGRRNMQFKPAYYSEMDGATFADRFGLPRSQ